MTTYFEMNDIQKDRYQKILWRSIEDKYNRGILYGQIELDFAEYLGDYLDDLEDQEEYEKLQAIKDYWYVRKNK